ncbi:MAG: hypothetical protein JWP10_1665 [Nocardioidaceae bacterium]|nr:hypothetical protein [Nocardioidaceae bacterium]
MSRRTVRIWLLASLALALLVLGFALSLGGALSGSAPGIPDPGALTTLGLPLMKFVSDALGVVTIGLLVSAAFLLVSGPSGLQGLASKAMLLTSRTAGLWALSGVLYYVLAASDLFAIPVFQIRSFSILSQLFTGISLGRTIAAQIVIALVIALFARRTITVPGATWLLAAAALGIAVPALSGHSAGSGAHDLAVVSLGFHVVGASLWVGGLVGLIWIAFHGSKRLPGAVARYSPLALWCLGAVAISGLVNAAIRVESLGNVFTTSYGALILMKVAALVVLAGFGWAHRKTTVRALIASEAADDLQRARWAFARLALAELTVMGAAFAVAVALSRAQPPVSDNLYTTRVEQILGGPLPAAPTVANFLFGFSPSGVGIAVVLVLGSLYARGLVSMHRRGDAWPIGRTISWYIGLVVIAWATFGGLGGYSHVLFSAHMVSHMLLAMVAPIFLVLGAPLTLAMRTLPGPRAPGERAPRQMLIKTLHSWPVKIVTHPIVSVSLFIGSLYGLYFTNIFENLMNSHLGHGAMDLHFLLVGTLYYYVLVGIDPSPRKLEPLVRFGVLMVTVPFHAFFAISIMAASTVIAGDYWRMLDRPYRTDLLRDQYVGGSISWAMGEIPLILVMGAIFVQWYRSDRRDSRRHDRAEANNQDRELEAYNAYLASLNADGKRRTP